MTNSNGCQYIPKAILLFRQYNRVSIPGDDTEPDDENEPDVSGGSSPKAFEFYQQPQQRKKRKTLWESKEIERNKVALSPVSKE